MPKQKTSLLSSQISLEIYPNDYMMQHEQLEKAER